MIKKSTIIVFIIVLSQSNMTLGSNWFNNMFKLSVTDRLYAPVAGGVIGIGAGAMLASGLVPVLAFALMGGIVGKQWHDNKRDNTLIDERKKWQEDVLQSLATSHQGISKTQADFRLALADLAAARKKNRKIISNFTGGGGILATHLIL